MTRLYFDDGRIDHVDIAIDPDEVAWTIQPNVVTDEKLRDSAALSVIGRSANSVGDPADIVAAAAGAVLRRSANTVGFGVTFEATLTWDDNAEVRLGTGGDLRLLHDGTSSTIRNDTGQLNVHSDAAMALTAVTNFSLAVGGTLSLGADGTISLLTNSNINLDPLGDLRISGDPGVATEVLTSKGPGLPPTWEPGGGAGSQLFSRGATWVSSSGALTSSVNSVYVRIPLACTITKATLLTAGGTGSCVVDVRKGTYAGFPTTASIAASAKPTISTSVKYEDSTLTGWTTSVAAGEIIEFVVESTSTFTQISIELELQP